MDYELLLVSEKTQKECVIWIKDIIINKLNLKCEYYEKNDYISICLEALTIIIDLEEIFSFDMVEECFGLKANLSAQLQVFSNTYYDGLEIMFGVIKEVINDTEHDLLLLGDSSEMILKRYNNKYSSNTIKDYEIKFPFDILDVEIEDSSK
ncbi:MAG: hypothetical protein LBV33_06050 [Lachnospiraceae bacterium]|jgi:hypothetical protein|nr:hypothetical protein [Lachnospiraceae bacterium]